MYKTFCRNLLPRRPKLQARLLSLKYQPQAPAVFLYLEPGYHLIHQLTISVFPLTCAALQTLMLRLLLTVFSGGFSTKNIFHPFFFRIISWEFQCLNVLSVLARYTYPFFGSSAPVMTSPPVQVQRSMEVLLPKSFCAFDFAASPRLLQETLTRFVKLKILSCSKVITFMKHVWFYNVFALLLQSSSYN